MIGDVDTHKSIQDYLITFVGDLCLGNLGWKKVVALSIIEAELISAVKACK